MKSKKKPRPREDDFNINALDEGTKQAIFKNYFKEMEEKTEEFIIKNPQLFDTKFYLFQTIRNRDLFRDMIFNIAYFYDINYIGNKDFMHIPNIKDILYNITKYPIMICTKKDEYNKEQILGLTTIKYEKNNSISANPFFPTVNETVLTITGVLAKLNPVDRNNNRIRGIGKELFKSSIRGAYNINKENKVRLICEIDCRNVQSLRAVTQAVAELQKENLDISISINGYYEILNENGDLAEAPTFMLEIKLNNDNNISNEQKEFNYLACKSSELFTDLSKVIEENTRELKEYVNIKDNKIVIYHELEKINALNVTLKVGNTADGNERKPSIQELQYQNAPKDFI